MPHVTEASDAGEAIAETGRLFLRNLAYSATEGDLTALLAPYGELQEVHLVLDRWLTVQFRDSLSPDLSAMHTPSATQYLKLTFCCPSTMLAL